MLLDIEGMRVELASNYAFPGNNKGHEFTEHVGDDCEEDS